MRKSWKTLTQALRVGSPNGSLRGILPATQRPSSQAHSSQPAHPPGVRQIIVGLYRRLLRECTYIPDPKVRQWLEGEIRSRFHDGTSKKTSRLRFTKEGNPPIAIARLERMLSKAKSSLNVLQTANAGDSKAFRQIISLCYGRAGKRRREWLEPLLPHATMAKRLHWLRGTKTPMDQQEPALMAMSTPAATKGESVFPSISSLLRRLGQTQIEYSVPSKRGRLRRIEPIIPSKNSWELPFPQSRRRNLIQSGYADFLDKLHVPLPEDMYQQLLRITSRQISLSPIPRRTGHELQHTETSILSLMSQSDRLAKRAAAEMPGHRGLTSRSMRRAYAEVLSTCPRVTWNAERRHWHVSWTRNAGGRQDEGTDIGM